MYVLITLIFGINFVCNHFAFLAYGKISMLTLVQSCILTAWDCRLMKLREAVDVLTGSGHIGIIFNEATTAGVLDSLKGCTRLLMTEEGGVVLKQMGAFSITYDGQQKLFYSRRLSCTTY